jgi:Cu/Ag efflux pump CusA
LTSCIQRLRAENVNVSAGRIEEGSQRYLVRTINQFANLDQMRDMLVKVDNGVPIRLKDVADVRQGHKEREAFIASMATKRSSWRSTRKATPTRCAVANALSTPGW